MQHLEDKILDQINAQSEKDRNTAEECAKKIMEILSKEMEREDFNVKHGFLSLARSIIYLSQSFCKDADEFNAEMEKADKLAVDKMIYSIMPTMKDGRVIDEDFDMDNLKVSRLMMAFGIGIDYTFWKSELGKYASERLEQEVKDALTKETETN